MLLLLRIIPKISNCPEPLSVANILSIMKYLVLYVPVGILGSLLVLHALMTV